MKHHQIEKIPVSNGNIYQLRVIETELIHHAEISLQVEGGLKYIETIQFDSSEDVEEIKSLVRKYISEKSIIEATIKDFKMVNIDVLFKHPKKK